jgi:DNA invertase Pin-like site-specific DNA recombinase
MPRNYGYARVSSKEQNTDRQIVALLEVGITPSNIFTDKQSGKDFNRPKYQRLIRKLKDGDTIFIKSIDRLGRNYEEIIEQWRVITKELSADIVVIDMPLLDTRQKEKDLTGTFIADLVLQILSYVAQTEREFNRKRQAEGIIAAKNKGTRFGRPPRDRPKELTKLAEDWQQQKISARAAARKIGVTHRTFIKWAQETLAKKVEMPPGAIVTG